MKRDNFKLKTLSYNFSYFSIRDLDFESLLRIIEIFFLSFFEFLIWLVIYIIYLSNS